MPVEALRISKPPPFYEWNSNTFSQLNDSLDRLWLVTNGRYSLNVETTDPDGSLSGDKGDMVLFDDSGTGYICVNMDNETDWDCSTLTD